PGRPRCDCPYFSVTLPGAHHSCARQKACRAAGERNSFKMNRIRSRVHLSLLFALLLVLTNLTLRPAKASQAAQTPAPTDQTDTSSTKSKKKKKTATTDD